MALTNMDKRRPKIGLILRERIVERERREGEKKKRREEEEEEEEEKKRSEIKQKGMELHGLLKL